jgi:hypothetical protein
MHSPATSFRRLRCHSGEVPTTPADGYADGGGAVHHRNPGHWPVMIFASRIGSAVKDGRFRRRRLFCSGVLKLESGRSREYRAIVLLAGRLRRS